MTHPTTELTQSIRERLALVAGEASAHAERFGHGANRWPRVVDAILAKLQEPSEGMLGAAARSTMDYPDGVREATCWVLLSDNGLNAKAMVKPWQAMIRHIRDGGQ